VSTRGSEFRRSVPALFAAIPVAIVYFAVLGIVLTAAGPDHLNLTDAETSTWIAVLYGWPTLLALVLTFRSRQPLLLTGNIFAIIFFVSLGDRLPFAELGGAAIVAGAVLLVMALLRLTGRVAEWIPASIVQGLIAGAVMPFIFGIFTSLSTSSGGEHIPLEVPLMIGSAFAAYLVSLRLWGTRIPPILPAFAVGIVVAALTGQLGGFPSSFSLPDLEVIRPEFSWAAIASLMPVLVALMTVPANIPSVIFMRTQGFEPPERMINIVCGAATIVGSFLGPVAVSLALPPVLLTAGPGAGERSIRWRSIVLPGIVGLGIALFANTAVDLAVLMPSTLLLAMAGLAFIGALISAVKEIAAGPLVYGPILAFAIALSSMTVFGLNQFFWSLVLGTAVSLFLERDGWRELRARRSGR
jgi:benzoate membrane transport protein